MYHNNNLNDDWDYGPISIDPETGQDDQTGMDLSIDDSGAYDVETLSDMINDFNSIYRDEANISEDNYWNLELKYNDIYDTYGLDLTDAQDTGLTQKLDSYLTMLANVQAGFSPHEQFPTTPATTTYPTTTTQKPITIKIPNLPTVKAGAQGAMTTSTIKTTSTSTVPKINYIPTKVLFKIGNFDFTEQDGVYLGIAAAAMTILSGMKGNAPKRRR